MGVVDFGVCPIEQETLLDVWCKGGLVYRLANEFELALSPLEVGVRP